VAAFIARGGVGATAPALVCRFRIQPNPDFPIFSEIFQKVRLAIRQFQKKTASAAEDSGKRAARLLSFTKKPQARC
jgi:hypothetical protein